MGNETGSGDQGLVAPEGVDEGSASSTAESAGPPGSLTAPPVGDSPAGDRAGEADVAEPLDTETDESRTARDMLGSGQQLAAGEG